ncbi:MAG TPA: hypothetical protein VJ747_02380 [Stellaceae bacterium]|nr:hypothetical protein [Stellaceae bacterium]
MTISIITQLAQNAVAAAQSNAQLQLKIIGARMTADLNKKLADLKAQSTDPTVAPLQTQVTALQAQNQSYSAAQAQLAANATAISDAKLQLGTLANAIPAGDGAAFDAALSAAQSDILILQVVPMLAGFQPDGIAQLKTNGLGIGTSTSYDLSTPAGQAQAAADVQAAQSVIDQVFTTTTQNQSIAGTASSAVGGQIAALNRQISNKNSAALNVAATAATKLQAQTQTQFHLLELSIGSIQSNTSWLINTEAQLANPPKGLFGTVQSSAAGSNSSFAQALTGATQPGTSSGPQVSILA